MTLKQKIAINRAFVSLCCSTEAEKRLFLVAYLLGAMDSDKPDNGEFIVKKLMEALSQ